jgi:hypothetical protein
LKAMPPASALIWAAAIISTLSDMPGNLSEDDRPREFLEPGEIYTAQRRELWRRRARRRPPAAAAPAVINGRRWQRNVRLVRVDDPP